MESMVVHDKEFWKNKTILITGHTGFKGSWLSLWLSQMGANIWGISLDPPIQSLYSEISKCDLKIFGNSKEKSLIFDIRDFNKLKKSVLKINPDIIFHMAAQPLVNIGYKEPRYTWEVNILGSINLLESIRFMDKFCSLVVTTTDKVYLNKELEHGYKETDTLGGHDPYSASKAATELLIESWRLSYCGNLAYQKQNINMATARSGNVIGGGDWTAGRIIPDIIESIKHSKNLNLRNPEATRPWQHVLEPLRGYIMLAKYIYNNKLQDSFQFNFGSHKKSNLKVREIVDYAFENRSLEWVDNSCLDNPHETKHLSLSSEKAKNVLNWDIKWDVYKTLEKTFDWYSNYDAGISAAECCLKDLEDYLN